LIAESWHISLTAKGPFVPWVDKWNFGQVLMVSLFVLIFETISEDRKNDYLHGNIYIFSIGAREQKLWEKGGEGATKIN